MNGEIFKRTKNLKVCWQEEWLPGGIELTASASSCENSVSPTSPQPWQLQQKLLSLGLYMFLVPVCKDWDNCSKVFSPLLGLGQVMEHTQVLQDFFSFPGQRSHEEWEAERQFCERKKKGWPLPFYEGCALLWKWYCEILPPLISLQPLPIKTEDIIKLTLSALRRELCQCPGRARYSTQERGRWRKHHLERLP